MIAELRFLRQNLLLGVGALAMLAAHGVSGASAVFTLDPDRSSVGLEGRVLGFSLQAQAAGSLTAAYEGTLATEVSAVSITFVGGGAIAARVTGNWEPKPGGEAGAAPANYGGKASPLLSRAVAAARGVRLAAQSAAIPVNAGQFDARAVAFQFIEGTGATLDYLVTGLLSDKGSVPLTGTATHVATAQATVVREGTTETLTIPIEATYLLELLAPGDVQLTLRGQLVATRTVDEGGGNTLAGYLAAQFPGVTDPAIVGPEADPEGDGLPNFVEFAFGLDPKVANPSFAPLKLPPGEATSSSRVLRFTRPAGLSGVSYRLEASTDLGTWAVLEAAPLVTPAGGGQEEVRYTDSALVGAGGARMVRLVVARP